MRCGGDYPKVRLRDFSDEITYFPPVIGYQRTVPPNVQHCTNFTFTFTAKIDTIRVPDT